MILRLLSLISFVLFVCSCIEVNEEESKSVAPPPTPNVVSNAGPLQKAPFMDREIMKSHLKNIFTSVNGQASTDANAISIIDAEIYKSSNYLGGPCFQNEDRNCAISTRQADGLLNYTVSSSAPAEALKIRACQRLVELDGILNIATINMGTNISQPLTSQAVSSAYQVFYRSKTADIETVNALFTFALGVESRLNRTDAWRFLIYSLCVSSGWQVL